MSLFKKLSLLAAGLVLTTSPVLAQVKLLTKA